MPTARSRLLFLALLTVARPVVAGESPLDRPLQMLAESRQALAGVRDYTGTMIKQERLNGKLQTPHIIQLAVRQQPFSVMLKWLEPQGLSGQMACYVEGWNNGRMRVKSPGLLRVAGFVSVQVNDPRGRQHSNHTIKEVGLAYLLEQFAAQWEKERSLGQGTKVRIGEYEYARRRCWRIETWHDRPDPAFVCYRGVLYIDKETKLPIRAELYDWPRTGGPAGGELIEVYSYINLQFNVGLGDNHFKK